MDNNVISMPLAVTVGGTHVSVAQASSGWAVMVWSRETGPQMAGKPMSYPKAVKAARAVADRLGAILDLPEGFGLIHVQRQSSGELEVLHESASGNSFGSLGRFGPHERDEAVGFALSMLAQYQPSRLGEVAGWHS